MSNLLHPGLILIAVGVLAVLVPKMLRKFILAIGPFFALFAALSMPVGTDLSIEFFGTGYHLGYMFVDKLSYVFCMIFALMAPLLSQLFFPADLGGAWALVYTYAIFAIGYVMRPVGGLVMAHLGDRLGRKRMFTWSLLLMALPTLAMGLLPTYAQVGVLAPVLLLLCRITWCRASGLPKVLRSLA